MHHDEASGNLLLTRYADVRTLVTDRILWRSPARAGETAHSARRQVESHIDGFSSAETTRILFLDDPGHQRMRLQSEGMQVTDAELRINLGALLIDGNLTTTDLIGNAARLLILQPHLVFGGGAHLHRRAFDPA